MAEQPQPQPLEGIWFSTSNLKLVMALRAAGFKLRYGGECTRLLAEGRESFTWHFEGHNEQGEHISHYLRLWEQVAPEGLQRPEPRVCFLLAREVMYDRTHVISESHAVPQHRLLNRGDKRLLVTPRLSRAEKEALAEMAS